MITLLRIKNLILVESAEIPFREGLNILSGETGAGKSAVIVALKLLAGEKGDPKFIRHHADKAIIEGQFELTPKSPVWELLENAGFDPDRDEPLIIRRELPLQGKSRIFIQQKLASLSFLKELGDRLFDMASQNTSHKLGLESSQREALDAFGGLIPLREQFKASWMKEEALKEELETLIASECQREQEIEIASRAIEEIEEARLNPNEEEELFTEYSQLATFEERSEHLEQATKFLNQLTLTPLERDLQKLTELDESLLPLKELLETVKVELTELNWTLARYQEKIVFSPERMAFLDDRLKLITRLKKKYGSTIEAILLWKEEKEKRLQTLASSDDRIEEIKQLLKPLSLETKRLIQELTSKRKEAAVKLSRLMTQELHSLNMNEALFDIDISDKAEGRSGQDLVTFKITSNRGGKALTVKESASGGELARIFLSLKLLLRGKDPLNILIFDEVDANIGGKTAKLLGEKLKKLGEEAQVIAITHFVQVASFADHHLAVKKIDAEGVIKSTIEVLEIETKEKELARMVGATL